MEVNENILHKPSILQEKVKERKNYDPIHILFIWFFFYHLTVLNILFPS